MSYKKAECEEKNLLEEKKKSEPADYFDWVHSNSQWQVVILFEVNQVSVVGSLCVEVADASAVSKISKADVWFFGDLFPPIHFHKRKDTLSLVCSRMAIRNVRHRGLAEICQQVFWICIFVHIASAAQKIRYASEKECDRYSLDAVYYERFKPITENIFKAFGKKSE
ncbi:UNVERIFIED_CONTAM: hypothetical protein NCL1_20713 [Trichonephila clavipes]